MTTVNIQTNKQVGKLVRLDGILKINRKHVPTPFLLLRELPMGDNEVSPGFPLIANPVHVGGKGGSSEQGIGDKGDIKILIITPYYILIPRGYNYYAFLFIIPYYPLIPPYNIINVYIELQMIEGEEEGEK